MPQSDTADLVLFYSPQSRAATTLRLLEELDLPYRLEVVDLTKGDQKKPSFLRRNPMGKIPLVLDGEVAISETGAIFTYLADRYASGLLAPAVDAPERAEYLKWLFFVGGVLEPAYAQKLFKWDPPSMQVAWGSFDSMLSTVRKGLSGREWLTGTFSAADIYLAASLRYGMMFGAVPEDDPWKDYVARWAARPASVRADAIDAGLMSQNG